MKNSKKKKKKNQAPTLDTVIEDIAEQISYEKALVLLHHLSLSDQPSPAAV